METLANPYTPGAGHPPPYLAGRDAETMEFARLLKQQTILENLVLTGLRGTGKTVLLDERFKAMAVKEGWLWAGADLSESASISEENLATRLLTDLALALSVMTVRVDKQAMGFSEGPKQESLSLISFADLATIYGSTPGLVSDKLRAVLVLTWEKLSALGGKRIVFAYDEAQNLADHATKDQFPLSLLLDVFQSIQKAGIPFMLVLTGLPTLFPKLVEARTYAERMFRVVTLLRLNDEESRAAVTKPIERVDSPITFAEESVDTVVRESAGYPYFIQFICREVFDVFLQQTAAGNEVSAVPVDEIQRKLDTDFFAGRWAKVSDRQRELLFVISDLDSAEEFSISEIVEHSKSTLVKPFSASHVNQMLSKLSEQGLIYKNRFGKYSFAVPLLNVFIRRNFASADGYSPSAL